MTTVARLEIASIDVPSVRVAGRARRTELVSLALPDRAGLLIQRNTPDGRPPAERPERPAADGADPAGDSSGQARGGTRTDLDFIELHRGELARVALSLARLGQVGSVVVCPAGVSPGRTALALAVAGLLRDRRPARAPVVTCAVCPPLGVGRTGVPHEVRVEADGRTQYRLVWELLGWEQIPAWLAGLH